MADEDFPIGVGALGGGLAGYGGASKLFDVVALAKLRRKHPDIWRNVERGKLDQRLLKVLKKNKQLGTFGGRTKLLGMLLGGAGGALIGSRFGPPKISPYDTMNDRDPIKSAADELDRDEIQRELGRLQARHLRPGVRLGDKDRAAILSVLSTIAGGSLGGAAGLMSKPLLGNKMRGLPTTTLGVLLGSGIGHHVSKQAKAKEDKETKPPSLVKALLPAMISGLAVGTFKGVSEKGLERGLSKLLERSGRIQRIKGIKSVPWGVARGTTSALAGIPYTLSAALAAKELNKGKKDK